MPSVICPACRRPCRVRQQSLGRSVVCTHCAAPFVAEEADQGRPAHEPLSYAPEGPKAWQVVAGLALLLAVAALVVWVVARG